MASLKELMAIPVIEQLEEQVHDAAPVINKSGEFTRSRDVPSRSSVSAIDRGKIIETPRGPLGIDKAAARARLLTNGERTPRV